MCTNYLTVQNYSFYGVHNCTGVIWQKWSPFGLEDKACWMFHFGGFTDSPHPPQTRKLAVWTQYRLLSFLGGYSSFWKNSWNQEHFWKMAGLQLHWCSLTKSMTPTLFHGGQKRLRYSLCFVRDTTQPRSWPVEHPGFPHGNKHHCKDLKQESAVQRKTNNVFSIAKEENISIKITSWPTPMAQSVTATLKRTLIWTEHSQNKQISQIKNTDSF